MDSATAALFPDRFDEDGLPEGWAWELLGPYYDVLETGKRPKGGVVAGGLGIPSIGAESIRRIGHFDYGKTKVVPEEFFTAMKKGKIVDGDILVYKDGGKPGELRPAVTYVSGGFPFKTACINEHVFRVRLRSPLSQYFGHGMLSSMQGLWQMAELATGVAQPGLNQQAMKAIRFVLPRETGLVQAYDNVAGRWLDRCNSLSRESRTLAALRDALLPRLMSGELRVPEAEEAIGA